MRDVERLQTALGERYNLVRELGHGGMATVYLAEDRKLDRLVAIKVLRPELASAVGPERFLREIKISARLQHPSILDLYDSGSSEGFLYYVMPYVEGESLRERLEREGQLPVEQAVRMVCEVAEALSYAHECGVVHRDIKPENILLSGEHVIVADFGIARAISEAGEERLTVSGHAIGTPAYMSPEQAAGEKDLDGRTDIYALACVLYEMLVGRPPFTGKTVQAVIAGHMLEKPRPLSSLRPSVPRSVATATETALAKAADERYSSASEFRTALDVPIEKVTRRPHAARRAARLLVPAAAAILLVYTVLQWRGPHEPDLDFNKIVVFPPIDRTGDLAGVAAGLDVAYAIEAALDHAYPLRWDDGWDRLDEPVRRDPLLLTANLALGISRSRGAGYYIDGIIGAEGDSLSVLLRLHDVRGDSVVAVEKATAASSGATLPMLGLQAVRVLLPRLADPGREIDISALTDRDPAAIALWIQGEREYRRFHFAHALEFYQRALEEDSLLTFAAIKGAQAAGWKAHFDDAEGLIGAALAHDTLLPTRYMHLARGFGAFLAGRADSAVAHFQAALAEDPEWSEAAMALGETYYHLLPSVEGLDSLAAAMFERALTHDTAFAPALMHLAEIAIRKGDVDRAERLIERLLVIEADTAHSGHLSLMLDCVRGVEGTPGWKDAARRNAFEVLKAARQLAVAASQSRCAKEGFQAVLDEPAATLGRKWGAVLGLQGLLVAEARDDEALALLDSVVAAGVSQAYSLYVLDVLAGARMELRAAEVEGIARTAYGQDYERGSSELHWLMGVWHTHLGNTAKVQTISAALDAIAEETGRRRDRLLAAALRCHLALARGDTTDAIQRLQALGSTAGRDSLLWELPESLAVERLLLAGLLSARGEHTEAHRVAGNFDHPASVMFLPFLPRSLEIRLRAAESLGKEHLAARYRHRLQALGRASER